MAIQTRGGNEADFDPYKMLPREPAGVLDTKKVYYTFAPGDCRRLATHEEMTEMMDESLDGIKQEFIADIEQSISDSEAAIDNITQTNTDMLASEAIREQQEQQRQADTAAVIADAEIAIDRTNQAAADAESIVLSDIATDTTVGVVRGGGDVIVEENGVLNLPDDIVLSGDEEEPAEPIPRDADLLGGHDATYFEGLVQVQANQVTNNTNSINLVENKLAVVDYTSQATPSIPGSVLANMFSLVKIGRIAYFTIQFQPATIIAANQKTTLFTTLPSACIPQKISALSVSVDTTGSDAARQPVSGIVFATTGQVRIDSTTAIHNFICSGSWLCAS